jgi:phosphatidylglycerophosphate synthase
MVLGVALASLVNSLLEVGESFIWRTTVLLCIGGLLVVWPLRAHHPFDRLGVANHITMIRAVLVLVLLGFVGMGDSPRLQAAALCIAMISSALDAVDGWAARRTQMSSAYGARFDMETDALLILTLSVLAWQFDKAGVWVLLSGSMRYAFVGAAMLWPWLQQPLPPSFRRKTLAVVQTVSLVISIAPFVSPDISGPLCACGLVMLAWSFFIDIAWLKRAWLKRRTSNSMAAT